MDIASLLAGGGLFASGTGLGLSLGLSIRKLANDKTKPVKAKCECTHSLAHHDPETKACAGSIKVDKHNVHGRVIGNDYLPCACQQYVGPQPYTEFYAPEITE